MRISLVVVGLAGFLAILAGLLLLATSVAGLFGGRWASVIPAAIVGCGLVGFGLAILKMIRQLRHQFRSR